MSVDEQGGDRSRRVGRTRLYRLLIVSHQRIEPEILVL
jgi:hypothetical protein